MDDDDSRYTRNLGRNVIIGVIAAYAATVGLCLAATGDLGASAAIATVPTIFAGPYVGLLITLVGAVAPHRAVLGAEAVPSGVPVALIAPLPVSDAAV